jgi:peptidoglycan/xylan/chitin deacetylase (PgdA/CDA1 family)
MTVLLLLSIVLICFIPLYWIYKPPSVLISFFQWKWPDVLWRVTISSKVVALTIDDTPSEYSTEIMQILKENDATATFFVIGAQVPGRESTLQDLIRHGNELGNHAMHDEPSRSLKDATLIEEIHTVEEHINAAYNELGVKLPPKYFRPGSGFFSDGMRRLLARLDYRLVLGSIYPHDPQISLWRVNANHILSMLRPGAIIICHDRRGWTAPMLRSVLPRIRQQGYEIVTVSELLRQAAG